MLNKISFFTALFWTLLIPVLCLISIGEIPGIKIENSDKYVHFGFYFILVTLWFIYFFTKNSGINGLKISFIIVVCSILYGIVIEFFQEFFTISRVADFYDVIANSMGSLAALISIRLFIKYSNSQA